MQWSGDLIGYGAPSYYMQKKFSETRGDVVLESTGSSIPQWKVNGNDRPALYWMAHAAREG